MKKLLVTAIGAAVAFGAFADAVRFEESTAGTVTALSQLPGGTSLWSEPEGATNTYAIGAAGTVSAPLSIASSDTQPTQALDIKTTFGKPLSLNAVSGGTTTNINDGLYFDSLVKFTVCEDAPADTYSGAKIIMWLQEAQDGSGNATGTNLIVRAGYLSLDGATVTATPSNYVCSVGDNFNADAWHRVTIKAIADITKTNRGVPGFAIYLDENGDTATSDINVGNADTLDASFPASELTEAATLLNNGKALFPSLDQTSGTKATLTSASFDGTGSITDLIFTDNGPAFAKDMVAQKASVTINEIEQTGIVTLADAIDAANGAAANAAVVITLAKGFDFDAPVTIKPTNTGVSVVLDFNGFVIENTGSECLITNAAALTVKDSSGGATGGIVGPAIYQSDEATELTIAGGNFWGEIAAGELAEFTISGGAFSQAGGDLELLGAQVAEGKKISETKNSDNLYPVEDVPLPTVAEHPWYENPKAVTLLEDLPIETGANKVSLFHGQGKGEYLGLTFGTRIIGFNLYTVDGTNTPSVVKSVEYGTEDGKLKADLRGVAISKALGIALVGNYYPSGNASNPSDIYAFPLDGGEPTVVTVPSTYSFDSAAFSPDGKYLFSNALNGEESNQYYVKWSVAKDAETGIVTLTKVGSITAGGRGRNMAYDRISNRDLVFAMADAGKVVVLDMTGDTPADWTAADLVTGLGTHSYGSLCVSGVNVAPSTPQLTVATSANGDSRANDVLNVYSLTVPTTGAVSASLVKSFNVTDLTAIGFGENTTGHGNTVYVSEDNGTIYYGRNDRKLYAAQFAYVVNFVVDGVTNSVSVFPDATVSQADPTKENYIFDGWFLPGAGQAFDLNTPVTQDLTLTAKFTAAEAKIGSALYLTLKAAVDAAQADDTVTVLADCTVAEPITFTKGITVSNDYTVTLNASYALRFANGNTPVTICGSGSFVGNGTGSPLLVGSNEVKSSYGIQSTYSASLVLNGCTFSAKAGQGNIIKVENGTLTVNDATITTAATNVRGVKADGDVGSYTATVIINGGTINAAKASVASSASADSGKTTSGTANVTINGGSITGPLSCGQNTSGTATITIPGTSEAKFSVQPAAAYVASGYETVLSDGWYVVTKVKPSGIDPATNTPVEIEAASEAAATNAVTLVTPTGVDAAAYKNLFDFTVTEVVAGEKYEVSIAGIKEEVQEAVSKDAVDVLTSDTGTGTVDVPAGLCYKVTTYTALGGAAVETKSGTSEGTGVSVSKPGTTQGFIKVELSTKPLN